MYTKSFGGPEPAIKILSAAWFSPALATRMVAIRLLNAGPKVSGLR